MAEITEFTFRIFLIFAPGVLAFIIVGKLTVHDKTTPFFAVFKSFILGFLCYLSYYPISEFLNLPFSFLQTITDLEQTIDFKEVAFSALMAIPVGLIVSALIFHNVLFKVAYRLGVSRKIGAPGVWSHIASFHPKTIDTQWVNIIDEQQGLFYRGFLQFFSDNNDLENEYFLRNVRVYEYQNNKQGKLIYQIPALYLNGKRENFKVEFPNVPYLPEPKIFQKRISIAKQILDVFIRVYKILENAYIWIKTYLLKSWNVLKEKRE
ncbi:hypothetical protein ES705_38214 [subsurface metagenome]